MMGMVFTEFLELVEDRFSVETADRVIQAARTSTDGAYTAVGKYDHGEMVRMVQALSAETKLPVAELLRLFGQHLAGRFSTLYSDFFAAQPSLFEFLSSIDGKIHVEVKKLYPHAELPSIETLERTAGCHVMVYRSNRHMQDLALGLIEGAARHYGQRIEVEQSANAGGGTRFVIRLQAPVDQAATADASAA